MRCRQWACESLCSIFHLLSWWYDRLACKERRNLNEEGSFWRPPTLLRHSFYITASNVMLSYLMVALQQLILQSVLDTCILRCQIVKSDAGRPPIGYMTVLTQRGRAVEFLALLPLEVLEWKEWAPFTKFHSSGAPTLIEIDMKKGDKLFSHTLALLSALLRGVMQTVCSENRQNLMRLFFVSGDHCVLIGVCVYVCECVISVLLHVVIVRINWLGYSLGWVIGRHFSGRREE